MDDVIKYAVAFVVGCCICAVLGTAVLIIGLVLAVPIGVLYVVRVHQGNTARRLAAQRRADQAAHDKWMAENGHLLRQWQQEQGNTPVQPVNGTIPKEEA